MIECYSSSLGRVHDNGKQTNSTNCIFASSSLPSSNFHLKPLPSYFLRHIPSPPAQDLTAMLAVTLVPLFLSLVSASQTHPSRRTTGPSCTTFKVPITASAQNSKILAGPSTTDPTSLLGQLTNAFIAGGETALGNYLGGPTEVKGTYSINMMYCQPEVYNAKRAKTLQCSPFSFLRPS